MIESNSKQDGSPVLRAIFSEVNCLGYIEGKTLLIAPYSGEGCTAHGLADEGVVRNPDRIVALTANLTLCFQGGNHHNSASALGRSAANRVDQILKWENRGEIPVFQPMKFEL